jgi:L-asparaginase
MSGHRLPRVALIGTGGTLSTISRHPLDLFDYGDEARIVVPEVLAAELPPLRDIAEIVLVPFRAIDSLDITRDDWLALDRTIRETADRTTPLDGIVVTHGTGTLEETAYFLNLTVKTTVPVVLVGAFRPWNVIGSDGPLNLLNAVRVALAPQSRGCGVLALLQDEIHAARDVSKEIGFRTHGFRSPELGMLGMVGPDGAVSVYRQPTRLHTVESEFNLKDIAALPRVDIVYSYAEAGREPIDALVAAGVQGIVVAGFATGRPAPTQEAALENAHRGNVRIFLATRSGHSPVPGHTSLNRRGFVSADNLNPQKARILAMLGLAVTNDPARLQDFFDRY